jgi:hypothetical protein
MRILGGIIGEQHTSSDLYLIYVAENGMLELLGGELLQETNSVSYFFGVFGTVSLSKNFKYPREIIFRVFRCSNELSPKFYVLDDNGEFYEANNIVLDESISSIGKYQFYGYENLLSITLQKNIVEIPSQLYKYCERLSSIYYNGTIDDIKNVSYTWYKNSERITIFVKDENGSWVALDK